MVEALTGEITRRDRHAVASIIERLQRHADPARAEHARGYTPTAMRILGVAATPVREAAGDLAAERAGEPPGAVVAVALALIGSGVLECRQVAYELLAIRQDVVSVLSMRSIEDLGHGVDNWVSADTFAMNVTGPAWRGGRLTDARVHRWAASPDRWWRRVAVVSTVPLNLRSRGGTGDTEGTLQVCDLVADDGDPMVTKGLSWALRELAKSDPDAVRAFLGEHEDLPALVVREVTNKLETGTKTGASART